MRQSLVVGEKRSEIRSVPAPVPGRGEVRVAVEACGVCASELNPWLRHQAPEPLALGHEVIGAVAEVGEGVEGLSVGTRVTGLMHQGFAEEAITPAAWLVPLPAGVAAGGAFGEPVACAVSAARRTPVEHGDSLAVIGLGFMGLLTLQLLRARGASRIICIDPRPEALELAGTYGATELYQPGQIPGDLTITEWRRRGEQLGVDVVAEASGTQPGLTLAAEMTRVHGFLSIVGFHQGGPRSVDMELWNWKALSVLNAHERRTDYLLDSMRRGLRMMAGGQLEVEALVTHRYRLDEVDSAFSALLEKPPGFVKAVVTT